MYTFSNIFIFPVISELSSSCLEYRYPYVSKGTDTHMHIINKFPWTELFNWKINRGKYCAKTISSLNGLVLYIFYLFISQENYVIRTRMC